jgi:subtilisin family serine protease
MTMNKQLRGWALLGILLTRAVAQGGPIAPTLADAWRHAPGARLPVLVTLRSAPASDGGPAHPLRDRVEVAAELRAEATRSQAPILEFLDRVARTTSVRRWWIANTLGLEATAEVAQALAQRGEVVAIEHDGAVSLPRPVAASSARPPSDDDDATWGLQATRTVQARETYGVDGEGVVVGILDTGYDASHPALAGRLRAWRSFVGASHPRPIDDNGHGTHCAGSLGGEAIAGMEIGVAPGVAFVAGKILDKNGGGTWSGVLDAMEWIVDPDGRPGSGDEPRLVSNSWGDSTGNAAVRQAMRRWLRLGILPVFAAGNSGPRAESVGYPGAYPEALAVAAVRPDGKAARFSSRGPVRLDGRVHVRPDIAAPGYMVTSARAGGGTKVSSGTSMAAPHVAGVAALLLEARSGLSPRDLRALLEASAVPAGAAGKDTTFGHGRLDAVAALELATGGGRLVGAVRDPSGVPVPFARATLHPGSRVVALERDGSFRVPLSPGRYTLEVEAFGFELRRLQGLVVTAGEETSADATLRRRPSGTIEGRLASAGEAVVGTVRVPGTPVEADTGSDGRFRLRLPAGTYRLVATAHGFQPREISGLRIRAGASVDLPVDLAPVPPILLMDDDDGRDLEGYFVEALGEVDHTLVRPDELGADLTSEYLAQYEVVVWFTGPDLVDTLRRRDQRVLSEYLSGGGRLLLTGQDIAYDLRSSAFLGEVLGARLVRFNARSRRVEAFGEAASIAAGGGADYRRRPDVVAPVGGAERVAAYGDGSGAGVRRSQGDGRVVYLAFGLEAIHEAPRRRRILAEALRWLRRIDIEGGAS